MSDYYEFTSYRAPFPIAFDRSKIALSTPLALNPPPTEGLPWDDLRKMFRGCQRMAKIPSGVETLPKFQPAEYRARERYRQTTDGRATA